MARVPYVVRADSPVKKVEDLNGKIVASNAIGSFGDLAMRVMLRKHGVTDKDVTTVEANFNTMPAMLDEGKVDLINLRAAIPLSDDEQGKYRQLFTAVGWRGPYPGGALGDACRVLAAHRPAVVDFLADHIRAIRWLLDRRITTRRWRSRAAVTKAEARNARLCLHQGKIPIARPTASPMSRRRSMRSMSS